MKQLLFIALSLIFFGSANAQDQYPPKILKIQPGFNSKHSETWAFNDPNSKFLFDNGNGKVFQSLIDNMRILAPNYQSNMPLAITNFSSEMPVQKMVPKTFSAPDIHFLPKIPESK